MTFWGPFRVPESEDTSYESRKYDISMSRLCPSLKAARGNRRHSPGGGRRGLQQFARHFNGGEGLLKIHIYIVFKHYRAIIDQYFWNRSSSDLEFVATIATGGRVKFLSAV